MNRDVAPFYRDPAFARFVAGKQAVDHEFYDTKTILAAGLGSPGSPVSKLWFDGNTASDFTLTNIITKNQMEQDEVAAIIGVSVTPLAVHALNEGANAAAVAANIARDVDRVIKRCSVRVRLGSNDYGPLPVQSLGGAGGLTGTEGGVATTTAAVTTIRSAPNNGLPKTSAYWRWVHPVLWYGNKALSVELIGATDALSADLNVRIGIQVSPYWRNYKPETGLRGIS